MLLYFMFILCDIRVKSTLIHPIKMIISLLRLLLVCHHLSHLNYVEKVNKIELVLHAHDVHIT